MQKNIPRSIERKGNDKNVMNTLASNNESIRTKVSKENKSKTNQEGHVRRIKVEQTKQDSTEVYNRKSKIKSTK